MPTALLLISFQGEYFNKKAKKNLNGAEKSAKSAASLLEYFRESKMPVIHVFQTGKPEKLTAERLQAHDLLTPKHEEVSILTDELNAFADNKLDKLLREMEVNHLLIAGLTAENQILYTVNGAKEKGYSCTVVKDACAGSSLKIDGEKFKATLVHQVAMAMMKRNDTELITAKEFIKSKQKEIKKQIKAIAKQEAIEKAAKEALEAATRQELTNSTPNTSNGKQSTKTATKKRRKSDATPTEETAENK